MSIVIGILTFILVITSLFLVMVVLMQRAKSDGGIGAAMGGGSMESTFGADTSNVLSGATVKAAIIFFVLCFGLYLAHIYQMKHVDVTDSKLPTVTAPAAQAAPAPMPTLPQPATSQPVETAKP